MQTAPPASKRRISIKSHAAHTAALTSHRLHHKHCIFALFVFGNLVALANGAPEKSISEIKALDAESETYFLSRQLARTTE
jgi:hypothetical protein